MSIRKDKLVEILRDKEFRDHFAEDQIYELLTLQIRQLRERNRWTQEELGAKAGMAQSAIARVENPNYTRSRIGTLSKLARAFDVALIVRFAPFGELVDWLGTLSPRSFAPPSFEEELSTPKYEAAKGVTLQAALSLGNPDPYATASNISLFDVYRIRREESSSTRIQISTPEGASRYAAS